MPGEKGLQYIRLLLNDSFRKITWIHTSHEGYDGDVKHFPPPGPISRIVSIFLGKVDDLVSFALVTRLLGFHGVLPQQNHLVGGWRHHSAGAVIARWSLAPFDCWLAQLLW